MNTQDRKFATVEHLPENHVVSTLHVIGPCLVPGCDWSHACRSCQASYAALEEHLLYSHIFGFGAHEARGNA